MYDVNIGMNIRKYRREKHLTQKQLADMVGVSDPYITTLEKGGTLPSLYVFMRIVDALEITPNHLLLDSMQSPELVYLLDLEKTIRNYPTPAKITACDAMRDILKLIEQLQNR